MSRIDDLIRQHCPDGVSTRPIGEIAELVRGNGMPKSDFVDEGVGCIHYGQIYTFYGTWANETRSFVAPATAAKLAQVDPGDVIITNTSENLDDVCKAVAWLGDSTIVTGGHATVLKHNEDPKFLSYYFQSPQFYADKKRLATGTKVIDVSAKSLAKIAIPVPPLEVQREIVRVLDLFQSLEAELEAELEARHRQYSHYADLMLTSSLSAGEFGEVEFVSVGDICRINRGRVMSRDYLRDHPGKYPVYSSQTGDEGVFGYIDSFDYDFESITWTTDGANAGSLFFHSGENFSITNVCGLLQVNDTSLVNAKFLYYVLGRHTMRHVSSGMGNPKLMSNVMARIQLPIPPIKEQERLVKTLDSFNALSNDLSVGLPAELNARRQQYEYYRDRLLTFEEAA
jgi:type I restriction enzyme S subunit